MKVGRFVLQKATSYRSRSRRGIVRENSICLTALKGEGRELLLEPKGWSSSGADSLAKGPWCEESPGAELGHDYGKLDADESDTAPSLVELQLRSLQQQQAESQRQQVDSQRKLEECQRQLKECQQQLAQSQQQQADSQRQQADSQRQLEEYRQQQVDSQRQLEECQQQLLEFRQLMRKLAIGSVQTSSS